MPQTLTARYELQVSYPDGLVNRTADVCDRLRAAGIRFNWYTRTTSRRGVGTTVRVICHADPADVEFPGSASVCSDRYVPRPRVWLEDDE